MDNTLLAGIEAPAGGSTLTLEAIIGSNPPIAAPCNDDGSDEVSFSSSSSSDDDDNRIRNPSASSIRSYVKGEPPVDCRVLHVFVDDFRTQIGAQKST